MSNVNYTVIRDLHKERVDSGGMFEDTVGVQEVELSFSKQIRFRAYAQGGFGGGVQCFRVDEAEARAEMWRLHEKLHGYEE